MISLPSVPTPSIITTAPTHDNVDGYKQKSSFTLPRRRKSPNLDRALSTKRSQRSLRQAPLTDGTADAITGESGRHVSDVKTNNPDRSNSSSAPPAYGDETGCALALPISRLSESSRSDMSSGDHRVFATTTTTTHTVSTTTFFRLPTRKKEKGPLFPLPNKTISADGSGSYTPRVSVHERRSGSPNRLSLSVPPKFLTLNGLNGRRSGQASPTRPYIPSNLVRTESAASQHSNRSSVTNGRPSELEKRGRSSTMSSLRRTLEDERLGAPHLLGSTRTSTSTAGRPSLGGLFSLSRLRQTSEPVFSKGAMSCVMPGTPQSTGSKQNSLSLPRELPIVIPERQEGDTPAKYLARLEEVVNRGALATLLTKSDDEFSKNVLRSYMRRFLFFEDPLDMAVRKLLMHVELPKETGQIDRTLQAFADRYHECNPGIFISSGKFILVCISWVILISYTQDETYFIAFSILILHTDVFNKNNKRKMQKIDYTKNTRGQGVAQEILECFYDNIAYTPFIHVEDDGDVVEERIIAQKLKKPGFKGSGAHPLKKSGTGPVDPYSLILGSQLDSLRPDLDDLLEMQDPLNYIGPGASMNHSELHRTFFTTGIIQILSSRSRPGAFATQATISNPAEASVGVVDMKVTKIGILWRKDPKKKKARSPWQEWGAILTGSQLYFFRNTGWIKSLIHQYESHLRQGRSSIPCVFKPPLEHFKPDFLLSTEAAVVLVDSHYKKHKNAFLYARQDVFQEVFLADNDTEMNDWLAKLNYAAAFRTAGVRMRGVIGGQYEGSKEQEPRIAESSTAQLPNGTGAEISIRNGRLGDELAHQIMLARRQILTQKILEANEKLSVAEKQLDTHLRNARHLQLLTPIQQKTRQDIEEAATRLGIYIRCARIGSWRVRCHRDILAMDLEEDIKITTGNDEQVSERHLSVNEGIKSSGHAQPRLGFSRLSSKSSVTTAQSNFRGFRSTQPSSGKLFNMDDIFRTPSRLRTNHRPQTSWELPPLTFERHSSVPTSRHTTTSAGDIPQSFEQGDKEETHVAAITDNDTGTLITEIVSPVVSQENEVVLLAENAVALPESRGSESAKPQDVTNEEDTFRIPEVDTSDGISKVRHSLQRKLQIAHVPNHHRGKKGKDSSSSAGITEDNLSTTESEGLARANGSFTVHGKKASVIKFGSEWQNMSPEDRPKLCKQTQADETKTSVPSIVDDETWPVATEASGTVSLVKTPLQSPSLDSTEQTEPLPNVYPIDHLDDDDLKNV